MALAIEVRSPSISSMWTLTVAKGSLAEGSFSTGCDAQGQSCDYRATWEVKEPFVEFTVTAKQVQAGRTEWVAIGFSDDRMMVSLMMVSLILLYGIFSHLTLN